MASSYVCPGCGAAMEFDSESQKMKCSHCGTTLTVEELDTLNEYSKKQEDEVVGEFNYDDEKESFVKYKCPSCGAELLTDENTVATFCSFCGTPTLVESRVEDELKPSHLIPFKIKKDEAKKKFLSWAKKGLFTPSDFYSSSTVDKITGMYVPFWLYNYNAETNISCKAERVHHEVRGDYEYVHTDHYMVTRDVEADFNRIPADAAENMPDDVMDKLEPFEYRDLTEFQKPYLSGYYAEKYGYSADDMSERIEKRVKDFIYEAARSTIHGYDSVTVVNRSNRLKRNKAEYVLMPVWLLNYRYKGKEYMFTLNGQTGRIVADRPFSNAKRLGWFAGMTVVLTIIIRIIGIFI